MLLLRRDITNRGERKEKQNNKYLVWFLREVFNADSVTEDSSCGSDLHDGGGDYYYYYYYYR
jgi:hypothetical protein